MADSQQELLRKCWLGGRKGNLSGLSEAKAWALREVLRSQDHPEHGIYTFIAERLTKVGGGKPGASAIRKFFVKVDADADWFPGKSNQASFGPKPALSGVARHAIAAAAMKMKERKIEPTYKQILSTCPRAVLNPGTKKPVDKKRVYDVFRERCYDDDPNVPWTHRARFSKTALTDEQQAKRFKWAQEVEGLGHTEKWYYEKVAWTDLCNTVVPLTETKASEQALAKKAGKGWQSADCLMDSQNLPGDKRTLKQKGFGTERIWWAPVLAYGKLHVEVLPENFPGECPDGAAILVQKVRAALNMRFQSGTPAAPKILYTDRGKGCFDICTGAITNEYRQALHEHGLRAFWGQNASAQPGHLQEVHLHETAVSWLRYRLTQSTPASPWKETRKQFTARIKECCADINRSLDVEGLCKGFPKRVQMVLAAKGDRITK